MNDQTGASFDHQHDGADGVTGMAPAWPCTCRLTERLHTVISQHQDRPRRLVCQQCGHCNLRVFQLRRLRPRVVSSPLDIYNLLGPLPGQLGVCRSSERTVIHWFGPAVRRRAGKPTTSVRFFSSKVVVLWTLSCGCAPHSS